jgi:hypothetical protein
MIYFLQDRHSLLVKVGYTSGSARSRRRMLQTGNGSELVLLAVLEGTRGDERRLHERFAECRIAGEWFRPAPELLRYIISEVGFACAVDR